MRLLHFSLYYFLINYYCKTFVFYRISAIKSLKIHENEKLNENVLLYFIKLCGTHAQASNIYVVFAKVSQRKGWCIIF